MVCSAACRNFISELVGGQIDVISDLFPGLSIHRVTFIQNMVQVCSGDAFILMEECKKGQ